MDEQELAAIDHGHSKAIGQLAEAAQNNVAERAACRREAFRERLLFGRLGAQGVGGELRERHVARTADALGAHRLKPLPDFERLVTAEQEVASDEHVGDGQPLELGEHGLERRQIAVDVREESHRIGRGLSDFSSHAGVAYSSLEAGQPGPAIWWAEVGLGRIRDNEAKIVVKNLKPLVRAQRSPALVQRGGVSLSRALEEELFRCARCSPKGAGARPQVSAIATSAAP